MRQFRWACLLLVALLGISNVAESAVKPPPQNQCPGDCSPCLGETDPFCEPSGPPTPATPGNCSVCGLNSAGQLDCLGVVEGQTGSDTCGLITQGTKVVQCAAQGSSCAFIVVHS